MAERQYAQRTVFIFDLDETLYPEESGLLTHLDQRINDYLVSASGIKRESVDEVRKRWVEEYGTTLRGAQVNCGIDPMDYIAYTHDIEIRRFLSADEELLRTLKALPGRKVVFSNSPRTHADGVIEALGLATCSSGFTQSSSVSSRASRHEGRMRECWPTSESRQASASWSKIPRGTC